MIDTAIIPCGGRGTRLAPISRWIPKELLPVGLRPVLFWTLDEAVQAGLRRAIIVTNPDKPVLETAARAYPDALHLEFVPQDEPRGLGDALLRARELLGDAPFLAMLPDNLFRGANPSAAVLEAYRRTRCPAVLLAEVSSAEAGSKGATGRAAARQESDGTLRVIDIADKSTGRFDTGGAASAVTPIGRFALDGDVFREFDEVAATLAPGAELDDVPVLQRLARRGALVGVRNPATFYDVGVPEGYRQAVSDFPPRA
jgi:UTP--glucose-1-phosphate uridylyltransferase